MTAIWSSRRWMQQCMNELKDIKHARVTSPKNFTLGKVLTSCSRALTEPVMRQKIQVKSITLHATCHEPVYWAVLYYPVLHCIILYYAVLYCIGLYYTVLYCIGLYWTVLDCTSALSSHPVASSTRIQIRIQATARAKLHGNW